MRNGSIDVLNDFRQGDIAAFETLFRLHQRAVYGWILRIVRNPAAAEDLTVESFWRIHRAHARFQPSRGFEATADPAISGEIRRKTALAFYRLPPKLRVAAVLAVIEERPHKDIAEALGISVAAVKLRVFRALRLLRKDLGEQGITP